MTKPNNQFVNYLKSLKELFYPKICAACNASLASQESIICAVCQVRLPYTNFYKHDSNPLEKKFWGRINIEKIDSLLYFEKDSKTQDLLHKLKYEGRQDIGLKLADILVSSYYDKNLQTKYDAIVSIPLHYKKMKRRGYNQCSSFAQTLGHAWEIPYFDHAIVRLHDNVSQTGKNRMARWENVYDIFEISDPNKLKNKHLVLIDDVLTTGATIEACAQKILDIENTKLSIITMACTV